MWAVALLGAMGLTAVPEAQAAKKSAATKSFRALVSGNNSAPGIVFPGQLLGPGFRQEILQQLNQNRFNFTSTLRALRQEVRFGGLPRIDFLYYRDEARFNFLVTRGALLFTLRWGRPPMTPGF